MPIYLSLKKLNFYCFIPVFLCSCVRLTLERFSPRLSVSDWSHPEARCETAKSHHVCYSAQACLAYSSSVWGARLKLYAFVHISKKQTNKKTNKQTNTVALTYSVLFPAVCAVGIE